MSNGGIIGPVNDPTLADFTTTFTASGTYTSPGLGPLEADYLVVAGGGGGGTRFGGGGGAGGYRTSFPGGTKLSVPASPISVTVGAGGVITKIESRPTIQLLGTRVNLIPYADYDAVDFTNIFNINWVNQTGYYADAPTNTISPRYAIITVKMYLESLAANFDTRLTIDDVEIAQGAIGNNDTDNYVYLDRNKYIYMDQVIVNIPSSKTSIFKFIRNLTLVRINGRYNKCGFGVTLDGWVF